MSNIANILGMPQKVKGLGDIYPIKVKDFEIFSEYASILQVGLKHFDEEVTKKYTLFELLIGHLGHENKLDYFFDLLLMTTHKAFVLEDAIEIKFVADDGSTISNENFNQYRDIVMKQNLIYEEKVFKSPKLREWAEKVILARQKNAIDMTIEDKISVVHVFVGVKYEDIAEYTIYQLNHTFQRIMKVEDYNKVIQIMCAYNYKLNPEPFIEKIDLYKNPYDDLFVDKNKLKNLDQALNK